MIGSVYFIGCDNRFVKIGFARNVAERLADLQTGCPFELRIIGELPGAAASMELVFHEVLSRLRFRGEWFELTDRLRLMIHEINSGARPDAILAVEALYRSTSTRARTSQEWMELQRLQREVDERRQDRRERRKERFSPTA